MHTIVHKNINLVNFLENLKVLSILCWYIFFKMGLKINFDICL